ncbi:MAG: hypothetical protein ACJAQ9_000228 [Ilumatobacter sp.]|jgi:hypothetical protein|tara:strand:- start:103 stop:489 length:387 start_codon:yes stop_codon:yes gene_type:complete
MTEFCQIEAKLKFTPIGGTASGFRVDVPFEGTATSSHWEGERQVVGVDIVRVGSDGVQALEIRARIGEGADAVAYQAIGRGSDATGPQELIVFETANEDLAFLNSAVAVALGGIVGNRLSLTVSLISA